MGYIRILLGSLIVNAIFLLSTLFNLSLKISKAAIRFHFRRRCYAANSREIKEIVSAQMQLVPTEIVVNIGKIEHRVVFFNGNCGPEVSHLGWGSWYTLRELEAATYGLCEENVIGEACYEIVNRGILTDGTKVAVMNLLNNRMLMYDFVDNGNLEQWIHGYVGDVSPLT